MAGSFASTNSSKTLSLSPAHVSGNGRVNCSNGIAVGGGGAGATDSLTTVLSQAPHEFLAPKSAIHELALALAKRYLDPLMEKERERGKMMNRIVKKGGEKKLGVYGMGTVKLDRVYLEGFDVGQVWEQVRGIVQEVVVNVDADGGGHKDRERLVEDIEMRDDGGSGDDGFGSDSDSESEDGGVGLDGSQVGAGDDDEINESGFGQEVDGHDEDENEEVEVEVDEDEDEEDEGDEEEEEEEEAKEFVKDVHGLNDGFFSIDDFNRQSEFLELQDSRNGLNDDDTNDEDDIDLNGDPADLGGEEENDDYQEDDEMDLEGDLENTNDIMYEDFFAPPALAQKKKKFDEKKKNVTWGDDVGIDLNEKIESDMARVRRDLFEDEDEEFEEGDEDLDSGDPMARRSAHQKRQTALMKEIRELEAENVAKKQWIMAGETKARDRPLNSLLEEDLDFERSGKPVPVITQEVTEGLEDMIKRRIVAAQFDEVIKRRPGDISDKFRHGRVEIDDSKPQQSLAEVYEREHLKSTNPEENPDAKDEKIQKEHREIEAIWADVSRKLDALASWHFTPKPPKPSLAVVADAPAISMEDAQPSTASGGGLAANVSMLAPQEIYKPDKDKAVVPIGNDSSRGREIVGKSGAPVSTSEMTSVDRKRRRRREKVKIRKQNAAAGIVKGQVKAGSRKDVVDSLKKGKVAIIGKGGEKSGMDGKVIKENNLTAGRSANFLKL
jgi:U3 small nucleolar RNA-associated protein MPP10